MQRTNNRRSFLMLILRWSVGPIFLACLAGVVLMVVSQGGHSAGRKELFWELGRHLLILGGTLFVILLYSGVYLEVVEASRGMPGLRVGDEPTMNPETTTAWEALRRELTEIGFRHEGWFSLDDFDETYISAWQHESYPAAAYVMYSPTGLTFRFRIVRKFSNGGVLISSTKLVDLSYAPPQGIYLQMRKTTSMKELWAWHLEAEALFPDANRRTRSESEVVGPRSLFVELAARWSGHRRRDRTWMLAVEPVGECWRLYQLCGMPLSRQFELAWSCPFWR